MINKSNKKNKVYQGFRLESEVVERLKDLTSSDPIVFSSLARVVDAALFNFVKLPKSEQKQIIKDYLTKDL